MGKMVKNVFIGLAAVGVLAAGVYAMMEACERIRDREFDKGLYSMQ